MADDRMRLVAEVVDQFTAPLTKYEAALRKTGLSAKQVSGDMKKDFDGFHGTVGKATSAIEGMSAPLRALGVGSLAAGLSVTGMVSALRNFSQGARDIAIMSKETGLAVDQLRAFGRLGEDFGVSAQTMQGGVKKFSEEMEQLRKRYGEAYSGLQAMNMGDLVEKLVNAPNMKAALDAAMDALGNIGNPVRRRKVAEMLFGVSELGAVADGVKGKYRETIDAILADIGKMDPATAKAATEFEKHVGRIGDAAERLKLKIFGPALKNIVGTIDDYDKNGVLGNEQEKALRGQLSPFGGPDPTAQQKLEGRRGSVQQQMELLDRNPNAPDYQRKRDRMVEELKRVGDELERLRNQGATVQQQSYGGAVSGGGALIHKAAFGGAGGFGGGSPGLGGFGGSLPTLGGGYGSGGGGGGSGAVAALPSPSASAPVSPSAPVALGGLPVGAGAAEDVSVNGRTYRYAGFTGSGRGRINSWLGFFQRPVSEGGLGMPLGKARSMVAMMQGESGENLNPNAQGDHRNGSPTAFGTAQWRLERFQALQATASKMGVPWTDVRAQQAHMRNEMLGRYRGTYDKVMGAGSDEGALLEGIRSFERPKYPELAYKFRVAHLDRLRRNGLTGADGAEAAGPAPAGTRMGDAMMQRFYGDGAPSAKGPMSIDGKASLHIQFENAPAGMRTKSATDGLFKDVTVSKSRQMDMENT